MKKFLPFIVVLGIIGFVLNSPVCGQKKSKKMYHDPHETIDVRIVTGIPEIRSEAGRSIKSDLLPRSAFAASTRLLGRSLQGWAGVQARRGDDG